MPSVQRFFVLALMVSVGTGASAQVEPAPAAPGVEPAPSAPDPDAEPEAQEEADAPPPPAAEEPIPPPPASAETQVAVDTEVVVPQPQVPEPHSRWRTSPEVRAERERRRAVRSIDRWMIHASVGAALLAVETPSLSTEAVGVDFGLFGGIAFGYRHAFRWLTSVQARAEIYGAGLGCSTIVDLGEGTTRDAEDCSAFGVGVDATFRLGPITWKFPLFIGIGPQINVTHARGRRPEDDDARTRTMIGGAAVVELGVALGSEERGEIAIRSRIGGFYNGIYHFVIPMLSFGWSLG